jgi:spermidine/putrescine transport system permease protein
MYSRAYKASIATLPMVWVLLLLLIPYGLILCTSFWTVSSEQNLVHSWDLTTYRQLFSNSMYMTVLLRSAKIAAVVTVCAIFLSYPLAYYLSFHCHKRKNLLYQLVILPLWVSYLVRGYAWKTILGADGVLNGGLQYLHITSAPLEFLLYSPFAVVLTLTHIYTPFVFLPLYASLEQIPRTLLEASADMGASPITTFWRVVFPLSLPGLVTGSIFSFVLTWGDFLAPQLVGGPSGMMVSNIVVSLFGAAYNWPLGAAIAMVLLLLVMGLLFGVHRMEKKWGRP